MVSKNGEAWAAPPKSPNVDPSMHAVAPIPPLQLSLGDDDDPWSLPEIIQTGTPWTYLTETQKMKRVAINVLKLLGLLVLLYLFVCSLSFLSNAFKLLGGKNAGAIFRQSDVLSNPIAGLMIGVLSTVMVQSSSTSTSVVVTMVAAQLLSVEQAVYIIMGANVGTSVTNTIVALFHSTDRPQFRRAFAAATVHDMFNWLSVFCILPLEFILQKTVGKGYLVWLSGLMISKEGSVESREKMEFLDVITKPFTKLIIKVDKSLIRKIAVSNETDLHLFDNKTLTKHWCTNKVTHQKDWCKFMFNFDMTDSAIGIMLLVFSLLILCICLVLIVKLLRSMLQGSMAKILRKTVNSHFPSPFGFLTGYLAIIVGAVMTFLVQSSSIFTSTLTPLVAVGVLTMERVYPLTLGSNIGTTGTALLAALANPDHIYDALHIALCHLLFNITGILIWYPIPILRNVPINLAKRLGNTTAKYRWFAVVYLIIMFMVLPGFIFALSLAGWVPMLTILIIVVILLIIVGFIHLLQKNKPSLLPKQFQDWTFLPAPLRSLKPYDDIVGSAFKVCCKPLCSKLKICKSCFEKEHHAVISFQDKKKTDEGEVSTQTIVSQL